MPSIQLQVLLAYCQNSKHSNLTPSVGWLSTSTYLKQRQRDLNVGIADFPPDMDSLCVEGHAWQAHDVETQPMSLTQLDNEEADEDDFEAVEAAINAQLEQASPTQVESRHRGLSRRYAWFCGLKLPSSPGPLLELQLLASAEESSRQPLKAHEGLRVLFAGDCQQRLVQEVALYNAGDTVLFFQWHHVERDNSLGRHEDDAQRFFLDCEGGGLAQHVYLDKLLAHPVTKQDPSCQATRTLFMLPSVLPIRVSFPRSGRSLFSLRTPK